MRKKMLNPCLITLIGLFTWACSNNDIAIYQEDRGIDPCDIEISVIDTSSTVTQKLAEKVANDFLFTTKSNSQEMREIKLVNDDNGNPSFYVINYGDDDGFVIVSATQNYIPILAYSDQGNFNVKKMEDSNVSYWVQLQKFTTQSIDKIPDSCKMRFKLMWADYNTSKIKLSEIVTKSNGEIHDLILSNVVQWCQQGYDVYTMSDFISSIAYNSFSSEMQNEIVTNLELYANYDYGNIYSHSFMLKKSEGEHRSQSTLLATQWGQLNGYNQFTPHNYPVGCVAVAVGQIMKYHQYPTHFDWNNMANLSATPTAARFLSDVGIAVDMKYGSDGSGSDISDALFAFKYYYGYTNARKINHDPNEVFRQLEQGRPVYMRGYDSYGILGLKSHKHAWVCDGFNLYSNTFIWTLKCLQYTPSGIMPSKYNTVYTNNTIEAGAYFHMNWGWEGSYDGMYYYTDVNIPGADRNYAHGREDIVDIYPNR